MKNPDAVLNECFHLMVTHAVTEVEEFFGQRVDPQDAANQAGARLRDFLDRWSGYIDILQGGSRQSGTSIVGAMLRSAESNEPADQADAQRLWPLARWIENALPAMRSFLNRGSLRVLWAGP